jgi:hypothetical protein
LRASACLSITPAPPLAVIDVSTGEVMTAQLFVAVLGASSYTYAEAARTRACLTGSARTRALVSFMGDVSATVVGDSLRSGVTRACFYEPAVNRTYAEMALTTALQFCRRGRIGPGVQVATRFVFAKLRNRQFFSLTPSDGLPSRTRRPPPERYHGNDSDD